MLLAVVAVVVLSGVEWRIAGGGYLEAVGRWKTRIKIQTSVSGVLAINRGIGKFSA